MSVLSALAERYTTISAGGVGHLHRLMGEWQLLADLSFADCLLLAPVSDGDAFVVLAQVRPFPAQTLYAEDMVGTMFEARHRAKVGQAFAESRIVREGEPEWREGTPIREETIPVVHEGRPIAVVSIEQNLAAARTPSHLELSYLRAAGDIATMVAEGTFPYVEGEEGERELAPRVGDGFAQIDAGDVVTYASPNAVSAYRRLGMTTNLVDHPVAGLWVSPDELARLHAGRPVEDEVEESGAWVLRRFMPILHGGQYWGAISLSRDITELRRRDRMLLIKDATIREVHHRVKNNLQTVASLLRLQSRRLGTSEARAELEESVRRITSIALVHETLSQEPGERVDFDQVAQSVLEMIRSSLVRPDRPIRFTLDGSAGQLPSDLATPLSLILTELLQNAVEHAFPGKGGAVGVELRRGDEEIIVVVRDDGVGIPEGFDAARTQSLGWQIVQTLATELGGTIDVGSDGGTRIELSIPLQTRER